MIWAVQRRTAQGRSHTGLLLRLLRHVDDHVAYHGHLAVFQEEAFEGAGPHRPGRQEAEEEAIGQVLEVTPTSAPGLGSPLPTAHLPPLPCLLPSHAHSHVQGRVRARTQPPSMANTCARTLRRPHRCARMRIRAVGHFAPSKARRAPCFLQAISASACAIVRITAAESHLRLAGAFQHRRSVGKRMIQKMIEKRASFAQPLVTCQSLVCKFEVKTMALRYEILEELWVIRTIFHERL